MTLPAGTRLGPYEILTPVGAGGMGEVYRARDTRLGRDVAVKVLPASFANDGDRLARFEQEARATSALNHPNILTVHDFGTHDGSPFIVAELLEGEDLRAQLNRGAIAYRKAIDYAQQIASGLAAAHAKNVVHRDLKPENVFVAVDDRLKILDFGLAKLRPSRVESADSGVATQRAITDPNTVMGTVGYMSPEQVRGQAADYRSDIFSFGVILYEMLSGQRAFIGDSAVETMNAILKEEPEDLTEKNPKISPALERIVKRCLERKPERRFQSTSDLCFAIEALSMPSGTRLDTQAALPVVAAGKSQVFSNVRLAWAVASLLLLGMLGFAWAYFTRKPTTIDERVTKSSLLPPEKSSFEQIAVSPDGRHLAFTAATGGKVQLWVRALDSSETRPLAGTQGATFPFWSPDSRFIGFFADSRLRKIEHTGGPVQPLCEVLTPVGGAWSRTGVILFAQLGAGLSRIFETRGEVTEVTTRDGSRQEIQHLYPTFLPDGDHFLYTIRSGRKDSSGTYLGSLDGTLKRRLLDEVTDIKYMAAVPEDTASGAGWLVYVRDGALLARPFDACQLEFTGEPFSLSDKVGSYLGPTNYFTFSVSDNGVLVFDPSINRQRGRYRWVDRRGQPINSLDVAAGAGPPWLSPDEKRFIADRIDSETNRDLWLCDISGRNSQRFTFDPTQDFYPIWSPDGSLIVWASARDGSVNLYEQAASHAGEETLLLKSDYPKFPTDWSLDGRFIIYRQIETKTKWDVWVLPVTGSGEAKPFSVVRSEASELAGTLSPDGRWLAYASDVSGRYEVYVQSFPGGGGKRQVSTEGGGGPRWRQDGRELFYHAGDGKLMAAPVRSGESLEVDAAVALFEFRGGTGEPSARYAVTADGQRFLINAVVETEPNAPLTVWVNWTAGVKK